MELFGLGWVLRNIGYFGSLVLLLVLATGGAIIGFRYAKQNNSFVDNDPQIMINVLKFAFFLWGVWLVVLGIQFCIFNSLWWGVGYGILAAVAALALSALLVAERKLTLYDKVGEVRVWEWLISSLIIAGMTAAMWSHDTPLVTLTKNERISFAYSQLIRGDEDYLNSFSRLEVLKVQPHPYFFAIGNIRLSKREEASRYFQIYADSLPVEKRLVWIALRDFFRNDFWSAEKSFKAAGQNQYALFSRFRNNQLSSLEFKQFIAINKVGNDELDFFNGLNQAVVSTEALHTRLEEPQMSDENIKLMEELHSLKQMILNLKNGENTTNKTNKTEPGKSAYSNAEFTAEVDRINKLRDKLNVTIEQRVIDFAVKQAPPLPIPVMNEFAQSSQYGLNIWATVSAFSFFLLCLFIVNAIWRDKHDKIKKFFETLAGTIGLSSRMSKLGWHSHTARSLAVRLAKMEPEDEKGLFSGEISRINTAIFPIDVLLGWRFHFKARRILLVKHIDKEEQEDLLFIHAIIRKQSGKLIPHGDEQALSITNALRERAETALQNYRKGQLKFLPARDELLVTQKELITLGDILEAFGEKPELTNYHLLGLEPKYNISDTEVKAAYRSVMGVVHPDKNPNNKFVDNIARLVIGAYGVLGNPNRRAAYETTIRL